MTPSPGIEPRPHRWKASAQTLRQPCSPKAEGSLVCPLGNTSDVNTANPVYTGFTGSIQCAVNTSRGSQSFSDLNSLSRNRLTQSNVTALPGNAFPCANPYGSSFPSGNQALTAKKLFFDLWFHQPDERADLKSTFTPRTFLVMFECF